MIFHNFEAVTEMRQPQFFIKLMVLIANKHHIRNSFWFWGCIQGFFNR
jgi:hypothetical protein